MFKFHLHLQGFEILHEKVKTIKSFSCDIDRFAFFTSLASLPLGFFKKEKKRTRAQSFTIFDDEIVPYLSPVQVPDKQIMRIFLW